MILAAIRFGLYAGLVTATTAVFCWSYTAACLNLSQARAIEQLSKKGWIFGRIPEGKVTWLQRILLHIVSTECVPVVNSAKAPRSFSSGTLSSSIGDLRCIEGLEIVILNGGTLNANDVIVIGELGECTELDLRFCKYDDSLKHLGQSIGQLKQLRTLRLSSYPLPGDFLRSIPALDDLQVCELSGLRLELADLQHVVRFPRMRYIDISFTQFDVETLPEVTKSKVTVLRDGILRIRSELIREPLTSGY